MCFERPHTSGKVAGLDQEYLHIAFGQENWPHDDIELAKATLAEVLEQADLGTVCASVFGRKFDEETLTWNFGVRINNFDLALNLIRQALKQAGAPRDTFITRYFAHGDYENFDL